MKARVLGLAWRGRCWCREMARLPDKGEEVTSNVSVWRPLLLLLRTPNWRPSIKTKKKKEKKKRSVMHRCSPRADVYGSSI